MIKILSLLPYTLSEWLDNTTQHLNKVLTTLKFISIAPSILCDLLNLLQDLRSEELTAKIAIIKPIIITHGTEFEQKQAEISIKSGVLKLKRTTQWLDKFNNQNKSIQSIHQDAIEHMFYTISMTNHENIPLHLIPEVLELDIHRIKSIRDEIRIIAIGLSILTLKQSPITEESIDKIVSIVSECTPVITLIDNEELNLDGKLITNILESTTEKSLRGIFSKRIVQALLGIEMHSSISVIEKSILSLRTFLTKMFNHWSNVYTPLYVSILRA